MWSRLQVRWGNPPHVTSPTWGPPPSCKQVLNRVLFSVWRFFDLPVVTWGKNFKRDTKRSNTAVWPERSRSELSFVHSWSPHKIATSVIVAGNFKFCLRTNLCSNLQSGIDRNAYINWKLSHGLVPGFVCFVPRLPSTSINHSVQAEIFSSRT